MSIDAIFLGLDGVLFDTEALHLGACNAAFAEAGLSLRWTLPALRAAAQRHGYAHAVGYAIGAQMRPRDKASMARLYHAKHRAFQQALLAQPPQPAPAVLALIDAARHDGCKLCVLTDLPAALTAALLERCFGTDVNSLFAVVTGGASFDGPAGTGPYAKALNAMGLAAADAVAIDTAVPALRAAGAAGLWSVSVAPYGAEVLRPQQFITYEALRTLHSRAFSPCPQPQDQILAA